MEAIDTKATRQETFDEIEEEPVEIHAMAASNSESKSVSGFTFNPNANALQDAEEVV